MIYAMKENYYVRLMSSISVSGACAENLSQKQALAVVSSNAKPIYNAL